MRDVDADQRPVHLQVDGHQQQILPEDVHLLGWETVVQSGCLWHQVARGRSYVFGPPLDPIVAVCSQLVVKETVEEMNLQGVGRFKEE